MIKLKIATPNGVVYEKDDVISITLPTSAGIITAMDDHVPLGSVLVAGEIIIKTQEAEIGLAVSSGMVNIQKDSVVQIMADTAERAENIDLERAEEARKRAEEFLKEKDQLDNIDYARIQAMIEKEMARISVGKKWKIK